MYHPYAPIRVADFFCGCGGTSAGLQAAGMNIVFGLDNDSEASATYRLNFPKANFFERDIKSVTTNEIVETIEPGDGPLLISACAPCQPYSTFASAKREDPRRRLLLRLIPVIKRLNPEFILVENVPGLRSQSAPAGTFNRFKKTLTSLDYHVASGVVDCQNYGVPQRRRRLLIMASRLGSISLPVPTHGRGVAVLPISTVAEWIGDLPPVEAGQKHPDIPNHLASGLTELNLRRIRATTEGGGRADWPEELQLTCHSNHRGHSDVYGRMRFDMPAPVLTTKCTSISNGRFGHPTQDRPITVREAASLQTFPRTFTFVGGIKSTTRQVGNAVPVLLAQRVGEVFVQHLKDYNMSAGNSLDQTSPQQMSPEIGNPSAGHSSRHHSDCDAERLVSGA
jgi:DNA (cytosine-5)-methyltransferase 1